MDHQVQVQQIAVSGIGGQGVLFLTRILAECATAMGREVIATETHGMAMRGGSVISYVKVGPFRGPMIRTGGADVLYALDEAYLDAFLPMVAPHGTVYLNARESAVHPCIDATGLAQKIGSPLAANLVLLGFSLQNRRLFFDYPLAESVLREISPPAFEDPNLRALKAGFLWGRE